MSSSNIISQNSHNKAKHFSANPAYPGSLQVQINIMLIVSSLSLSSRAGNLGRVGFFPYAEAML